MTRVLFALVLAFASAAASAVNVGVNVTFTSGAALYASSLGSGVTVASLAQAQIDTANANYAASGIDIQLVLTSALQVSAAPADSASMTTQYNWARDSPVAQTYRGDSSGSSISVQISDPGPGASTQGVMFNGTVTDRSDAVFSLPVRALGGANNGMELAISKIIGSDPVYARRDNRYGYQRDSSGNSYGTTFCAHTIEGAGLDPSTPAAYLSPIYYLEVYGYTHQATNGAPTAQISCEAAREDFAGSSTFGCGSGATNCASALADVPDPGYCHIKKSDGTDYTGYAMAKLTQSGSAAISCTDTGVSYYSSPSLYFQGMPLGDSTHNSVSKMNARKSTVAGWASYNLDRLRRAQEAVGLWAAFKLRHGL